MVIDPILAEKWHHELIRNKYVYNFTWLGINIFQEPEIIVMLQDIIWQTRPDLIIETGIAKGGSLVLSASMLAMLDIEEPIRRQVLGIDIDIRDDSRAGIEHHPLNKYIGLLQGSSIDPEIITIVGGVADSYNKIMVILDSDHSHHHVLAELKAYAPLVSRGCYCIVCDTGVEDLPAELCFGRPWGKGNSPKSAIHEYLTDNIGFVIDTDIERKLGVVSNPDGWLKRIW